MTTCCASSASCWTICVTTAASLRNIRETKTFDDDTAAALREQIAEFKKGFQTSEGKLLAGREEHVALEEEDVTQEQIVRQKRG